MPPVLALAPLIAPVTATPEKPPGSFTRTKDGCVLVDGSLGQIMSDAYCYQGMHQQSLNLQLESRRIWEFSYTLVREVKSKGRKHNKLCKARGRRIRRSRRILRGCGRAAVSKHPDQPRLCLYLFTLSGKNSIQLCIVPCPDYFEGLSLIVLKTAVGTVTSTVPTASSATGCTS